MQRLVEIVDGRNAIVEGLDEDRLRSEEAACLKTSGNKKEKKSFKKCCFYQGSEGGSAVKRNDEKPR